MYQKIVFDTVTILVTAVNAASPSTEAPKADRRAWIALGIVCLGQLMIVLDSTIVNVALPAIQQDLGFTQANLTWVVNAYLLTFGSFLLLAGRLGDLVGRKRVFLSGLALFTLASALCGLATSEATLIGARFLQGLGGAIASAVVLALIVTEFPRPQDRAKAMSAYMFISVAGGSVGLLAGGLLTEAISWHWIFFINVPIGLVGLVLGVREIDETEGIGLGHGVDVLGSLLVTVAMMLGVYAIVTSAEHGWGSPHTLGFGGASVVLLTAFFRYEARIANPIVPLRIFRLRSLVRSGIVRGLLITGMFAAFFFGALFFEHVLGFTPFQTGLAFLPMTLVVGMLSLGVVARLCVRFGEKPVLIAGLSGVVVALVLLSRIDADTAYFPQLFFAFALMGLGAGTAFMPLLTIAMAEVPARDAGLASGLINVSMQISAAIGLAVLGTLATSHTHALAAAGDSHRAALVGGYQLGFEIAAGFAAAGLLVALFALRPPGTVAHEASDAERVFEAEVAAQL